MKPYLTQEKYDEHVALAKELDFDCNYFNIVNYGTASYICNGIGAYWFPEILRKAINALLPELEPVANNHDLGFSLGEETNEAFTEINTAFRTNGFKVASKKYPWYHRRRYLVMFNAWNFARLCQKYGWKTYVNGIKQYKEQMETERLAETSM